MNSNSVSRLFTWLLENIWQLVVLIVASYVLVQYYRGAITKVDELIVWLIAIVELLAVSGFIDRNLRLSAIQKSILELRNEAKHVGLSQIYEDRTQLPSLLQDLQSTHREMFVLGLGLVNLTLTFLDALKEKAIGGCKVHILMIAPRIDGKLNPVIQQLSVTLGFDFDLNNYANNIEGSLNRLMAMKMSLPEDKRGNVEIKVYDCVPTFVMMAFDGNTRKGKLRVDMIPYKVSRSLWPVLEFKHSDRSKLYEFFYNSANQLWLDSRPWSPVLPQRSITERQETSATGPSKPDTERQETSAASPSKPGTERQEASTTSPSRPD